MNVPIIRLEVERMKETMLAALPQHSAAMDEAVKLEIENYCTPENINRVVMQAATSAMDEAVKQEVRDFFRYNANGRKAIKEAVAERLEEWFKAYSREINT